MDTQLQQETLDFSNQPANRRFQIKLSGGLFIISICIVVVALLVLSGWYIWRLKPVSVISQPTSPPATHDASLTASWKRFTNASQDFSVLHPPTWTASEPSTLQTNIEGDLTTFVINKGGFGVGLPFTEEPKRYKVIVDGQELEAREWTQATTEANASNTSSFLIIFEAQYAGNIYFFRLGGREIVNPIKAREKLFQILETFKFTPLPGATHFSSGALGVNFYYVANTGGTTITTKVSGNRVYLVDKKQPDDSLRFLEVFAKDPEDTIEKAIGKVILGKYNAEDCPITTLESPPSTSLGYNYWQQRATIRYHAMYLPNDSFVATDPSRCPADYSPINWSAYFIVDSRYPSKLIYISDGQDTINASTDTEHYPLSWRDTVAFYE